MSRALSIVISLLCVLVVAAAALLIGTALPPTRNASAQQPPPEGISLAAAELLAEQRDTNLSGPKIVETACGTNEAFTYSFDPSAGKPPVVTITVVNRGDCPIGAGGQTVPPGGVLARTVRSIEFGVDCQQGAGRCKFEVTVTKVRD